MANILGLNWIVLHC